MYNKPEFKRRVTETGKAHCKFVTSWCVLICLYYVIDLIENVFKNK